MAKAKKRRRNQAFNQGNIDQGGGSKAPAANDAGDVSDSGSDGNTISDAEIRTTLRVLSTLGADMETFRSRRMKELRVAVNPLVEERLKQMAGAGLGAAGTPSLSGKDI
ncbi:hypothetical protein T484DRAFT_1800957 [Baffinella frigidus]|nr:hypothetical protein T484DRAFT_1800957 [Cryptophyta sp. CCMP2293]